MSTKLLKSFAKTIIVGEKAKMSIAKKIFKTMRDEPHRAKELRRLAVLLNIEKLISPQLLN